MRQGIGTLINVLELYIKLYIIIYNYYTVITDAQLLEVSGNVHVDGTDIESSDHFLVWMELGLLLRRESV